MAFSCSAERDDYAGFDEQPEHLKLNSEFADVVVQVRELQPKQLKFIPLVITRVPLPEPTNREKLFNDFDAESFLLSELGACRRPTERRVSTASSITQLISPKAPPGLTPLRRINLKSSSSCSPVRLPRAKRQRPAFVTPMLVLQRVPMKEPRRNSLATVLKDIAISRPKRHEQAFDKTLDLKILALLKTSSSEQQPITLRILPIPEVRHPAMAVQPFAFTFNF
jgi:hypothetical protein